MGDNFCCCCCSIIYIILLFVFVITSAIIIPYFDFTLNQCYIKNVTYPTSLPINGSVNGLDGYINCDCGKYCTSHMGTCINIYVSTNYDSYTEYKINNDVMDYSHDACSITNTDCSNDGNYSKIKSAITTGSYYYDLIGSNKTIDCYLANKDYYYLSNSFNVIGYIVFASIFGIITLCIIYPFIHVYIKENTTCIYLYTCVNNNYKKMKGFKYCHCSLKQGVSHTNFPKQYMTHIDNSVYTCQTEKEGHKDWVIVVSS